MNKSNNIDWAHLKNKAKKAFNNAYAPYSKFHVGSALVTESNEVFYGCNVENASYGLTVCAERNCICNAVVNGQTQLKALVVYTEQKKLTPPCGACRQVIVEFFQSDAQIKAINHLGDEITWSVNELLPAAFIPKHLLDEI